ncbi:lipid II:glycine glycyltransferase FemX [Flexivirga caeni]|uniref:Peptidoglycan bridge formation glycyltransferase FemA/FemB family protein n=1 Tax=Flexivirga caeni TaxID=2294115 RepID=A0A3M9LZ39_9MICO|nr:peptidoglycan bridge formation glycyltransferase FemA/FemB family protein [Flexivirga caeni]RNI17893.1 peptidoglycan bridge formation glycyltransferase FemA/FemB family protein [Flexivirga caeni]
MARTSTTHLRPCDDRATWDAYVNTHGGHPLQLWGWGQTKAAHGWHAIRLLAYDGDEAIGGAQVLTRHLPWPLRALSYVPRGPVGAADRAGAVLDAVAAYAHSHEHAVTLTIEPDWSTVPQLSGDWRRSDNTILIPQTLVLDLRLPEDRLLAAMSKKTRQYIRKSGREPDLAIRPVTDRSALGDCLEIYRETAARAHFALHSDDYYRDVFDDLGERSAVFAAYAKQQPVAFLWEATSATTAFELYGGMTDLGARLRANYALKWHAIRAMRARGVQRYDVNGLVSDGVSTFKRGFADHEDLLVGTFDKPLSPLYAVWDKGLPLAKQVVRRGRPGR